MNQPIREYLFLQQDKHDQLLLRSDKSIPMAVTLLEWSDPAYQRAALSFLCRAAKKKAERELIEASLGDHVLLHKLLSYPDPKVRKHTARLMGALSRSEDAAVLIDALKNEQTRFVRPSMILSLGAIGTKEARDALFALSEPIAANEDEEKHVREEREALRMAKARLTIAPEHTFTGLKKEYTIELRAPMGLTSQLVQELEAAGLKPFMIGRDRLRVKTADLALVYQARGFMEALIVLTDEFTLPNNPDSIAQRLYEPIVSFLHETHAGEAPYPYRIEYRGEQLQRNAFARAIAQKWDASELINLPSAYDIEVRIEPNGMAANVYLKLYLYEDKRFPYRKRTVAASMHPATAAALLRFLQPYCKAENPRVLDPFCGSGTLLFERECLSPCHKLHGVDISKEAIGIARENALAANSKAQFVHNDCLRFTARNPYDEVISNLPFGNRVGNHKNNEVLYRSLIQALPGWLKEGGIAMLYTMEYTLLKNCVKEQSALKPIAQLRTESGGLLPWVMVLQKV